MSINKLAMVYAPIIAYLTDDMSKGISLSEARSIKEANANANAELANKAEVGNVEDLYSVKVDIFMSASGQQQYVNDPKFKIEKADFLEVASYAKRYADSAFYAEATNCHKQLIEAVEIINNEKLCKILEIEFQPTSHIQSPTRKSMLENWNNNQISTAKNIGELVKNLSSYGVALIASKIREALVLESEVAHIANFCKNPKSFLQRLNKAEKTMDTVSETFSAGMKVTSRTLAYNKAEYKNTFDSFQEQHAEKQKQFNKLISEIKNAITEAEAECSKEYEIALTKARIEQSEYNTVYTNFTTMLSTKKAELKKQAGSLRIIR